jgi:hypothetical protein
MGRLLGTLGGQILAREVVREVIPGLEEEVVVVGEGYRQVEAEAVGVEK